MPLTSINGYIELDETRLSKFVIRFVFGKPAVASLESAVMDTVAKPGLSRLGV